MLNLNSTTIITNDILSSFQLFSSRRRVRIFLMDAEEEDEDWDGCGEDEDPGDQSGELNSSEAPEGEMQIDNTEDMEEDENKENTSFSSSTE